MCSSPRPKRTVKVTASPRVVSIMALMDEAARHRFTERANQAADRKEAIRQKKEAQRLLQKSTNNQRQHQEALKIQQQKKGLSYWLFSASFADIFKKLITGY